MNSKQTNELSFKDYLFLTIGLFLFFIAGIYLQFFGTIPKDTNLIFGFLIGIVVVIPVMIYVLKKLND